MSQGFLAILFLMETMLAGFTGYLVWIGFQETRKPGFQEIGWSTNLWVRENGVGERKPASITPLKGERIVAPLNDIVANILDQNGRSHSLALKLEVELFGDEWKAHFEQRSAIMRHVVLDAIREQSFERLQTIEGKVLLKDILISRMNDNLKSPAVRNLQYATFYLQ